MSLYAVYLWTLNEILIRFPSVLLDIKDQTTAGVSCSVCLFHQYHLTRFRLHQISFNCPPNSVRSMLWRHHLVSPVCIRNQEKHQTDVWADQPILFRGTCTARRAAWPGSTTKPLTGLFRLWLVLLSPPTCCHPLHISSYCWIMLTTRDSPKGKDPP